MQKQRRTTPPRLRLRKREGQCERVPRWLAAPGAALLWWRWLLRMPVDVASVATSIGAAGECGGDGCNSFDGASARNLGLVPRRRASNARLAHR